MKSTATLATTACLAFLLLLASAPPATPQWEGRSGFNVPAPTERGDWEGTWFHIQRDRKAAVWIRHDGDGPPKIKMQYFSELGDEQFRTDWSCSAEYEARGTTGYFDMTITEGDANVIHAEWDWRLEFPDSGRTESSSVEIYRTGDGRALAFLFEDWTRSIRRGSHVQNVEAPHVWTFRKISRRELIWDELPL